VLYTLWMVNGCTTLELAPYVGHSADKYKTSQTKNGLAVAIQPMNDPDDSVKYFGIDLLSKNTLPIYLVTENNSSSYSYIIRKESISMSANPKNKEYTNFTDEHVFDNDSTSGVVSIVGAVALSPILLIGGAKSSSDISVKKHSIRSQEYQTQALSPMEKSAGFLYFHFPGGIETLNNLTFHLEAYNPLDSEQLSFDFDIYPGQH